MPIISLRISEDQKNKMDEMKWINWSEIIRRTIDELIPKLTQHDLAKAVIVSDLLRKQVVEDTRDTESVLHIWRR